MLTQDTPLWLNEGRTTNWPKLPVHGTPEPTWEQFLKHREQRPWWLRLNRERKDLAKILYKSAVYQYSRRRYHVLLPTIMVAAMLQPAYVARQLIGKYWSYRVSGRSGTK